ncbi:hypothetical protein ACFLYB_01005 [Chloroflexota bacterium]
MSKLSARMIYTMMIGIIIIAGIIVYWMIAPISDGKANNENILHGALGISVAHAQVPASPLGCSSCHTEPVPFTNCTDCHSGMPTVIGNIEFDHHSNDPPDDVDCVECHASSGNDARYVNVPIASMDYCDTCHESTHD